MPSVFGPPCRTPDAKTGIKTWKGRPRRLTKASSRRIDRIGTDFDI
jgi:hypothetical protein